MWPSRDRKARSSPSSVRSPSGQLLGNDYVVLKGLNAGENLIVAGIQKIGDGAPVRAEAAAPEAAPAAPQGK